MTLCDFCGKPLENGKPMYMGRRHAECQRAKYGELADKSTHEIIAEAKKLANNIKSILSGE